jgi:hypothetical protein
MNVNSQSAEGADAAGARLDPPEDPIPDRDRSPGADPEIAAPVSLCDASRPGRLDRAAVGWTRRPLHHCNLTRRLGAKKRWNYWAFTTETEVLSNVVDRSR